MDKTVDRIKSGIKTQQALGLRGESWDNQVIASDVLFDDLGYNRADRPHYQLDEQTKNILLVNARQDTAHALSNTISLLDRIDKLDRTVQIISVFLVISGSTTLYLLWKMLQHNPIFID